ncbi:MAG: iron-containing alcohol dehydrogenase [Saccharofermentans sp.]|nr:iron-containing alcohol dehydrogenase [Saccharofermentans sp.]
MTTIFKDYNGFLEYISSNAKTVFAVTGKMLSRLDGGKFMEELSSKVSLTVFSNFKPNPDISSVIEGVGVCQGINPDLILAVGGGSAIDVAKAIKTEYAKDTLLAVVPTTAGSGSEATKIAVIYKDGVKLSLGDPKMEADAIMFDPAALLSLPDYQRRSAMADAMCHAIESMWSNRANEESTSYAIAAATGILQNYKEYLDLSPEAAILIQQAAYDAGRAINITATTGGHAMAYKMTTMKGFAHGHSCILAVKVLWDYMQDEGVDLKAASGFKNGFMDLYDFLGLSRPVLTAEEIDVLASSVNRERLANNPKILSTEELKMLYARIAKENT